MLLEDSICEMAREPLKVLSYAYIDMPIDDYQSLVDSYGTTEDPRFREQIENGLTYIGTFGLNDPIRDKVHLSIQMLKFGSAQSSGPRSSFKDRKGSGSNMSSTSSIEVRMISGDHIETCRKVALIAGIITEDEFNNPKVVMSREQFRNSIGEVIVDGENITFT